MSKLQRAEEAARAAAALHMQTAIRLADEMVADPTSMDLPRMVDHHGRTLAAREYALAVWESELIETHARTHTLSHAISA